MEESRRWKLIREAFPSVLQGFIGGCQTARRVGQVDEAEKILESGFSRFGKNDRLLAEYALCAACEENWAEAVERWEAAYQLDCIDAVGFAHFGAALIKAGSPNEVAGRLKTGLDKHPGHVGIRVQLAEAATAAEDWITALELWREIIKDEPDTARSINGFGQALWHYQLHSGDALAAEGDEAGVENGPERADLEAPVDVGLVNDTTLRDLMMRFESLGPNCEFGLVQRRYGAEPLNLLRWTSTAPNVLIDGIRKRFQGLGALDSTMLDVQPAEIMVRDKTYGFSFHTFCKNKEGLDLEDFRLKQSKHFSYLKKVFLNRLHEGGKIYVYKADTGCDLTKITEIYQELRKLSAVSLLFVDRVDRDNPAGSVKRVYDHLYLGYISRFGRDGSRSWDIAFENWVDLCKQVVKLVDEEHPLKA